MKAIAKPATKDKLADSLAAAADAYRDIAAEAAAQGDIYTCHRAVARHMEMSRRLDRLARHDVI